MSITADTCSWYLLLIPDTDTWYLIPDTLTPYILFVLKFLPKSLTSPSGINSQLTINKKKSFLYIYTKSEKCCIYKRTHTQRHGRASKAFGPKNKTGKVHTYIYIYIYGPQTFRFFYEDGKGLKWQLQRMRKSPSRVFSVLFQRGAVFFPLFHSTLFRAGFRINLDWALFTAIL